MGVLSGEALQEELSAGEPFCCEPLFVNVLGRDGPLLEPAWEGFFSNPL
jgi:hypothetical protein